MKFFILSAPSGSGKTTILRELLRKNQLLDFSVSATTRLPRADEIDGVNYYFLSEQDFKQKIENGEFLEWEEVYAGVFYGTLKSEIERILSLKKFPILDVDVLGGLAIKELYGDKVFSFFIKIPSLEILKERLIKRATEKEEMLELRLIKAEYELKFAEKFDFIVLNDNLDVAVETIQKKILKFVS